MNYYDSKKNVEEYINMAEGFDGTLLIEILKEYLPKKSTVLELGMGPGKDLDILGQSYIATGSDRSQVFLDRYLKAHPDSDLLHLDAISLSTDRTFDCIYSNKVLIHLTRDELNTSFARQRSVLAPGGLILHSFWYATEDETHAGMHVSNFTEKELAELVGRELEIIRVERYEEMEENDSLFVLARKPKATIE